MQTNMSITLSSIYSITAKSVESYVSKVKEKPIQTALTAVAVASTALAAYYLANSGASSRTEYPINTIANLTNTSANLTNVAVNEANTSANLTNIIANFTNASFANTSTDVTTLTTDAENDTAVIFSADAEDDTAVISSADAEDPINISATTEDSNSIPFNFIQQINDFGSWTSRKITDIADSRAGSSIVNLVSQAKEAALAEYSIPLPASLPYVGGTTLVSTGLAFAGYAAAGLTGVAMALAGTTYTITKINQFVQQRKATFLSQQAACAHPRNAMDFLHLYIRRNTKIESMSDMKSFKQLEQGVQAELLDWTKKQGHGLATLSELYNHLQLPAPAA